MSSAFVLLQFRFLVPGACGVAVCFKRRIQAHEITVHAARFRGRGVNGKGGDLAEHGHAYAVRAVVVCG